MIDPIAQYFGISGPALLATFAVISLVSRLIGKVIPDDATGWQAHVRIAAKIIGLYTQNRVSKK